ncbi:MAG: SDR family oxidoreductase [Gammaproteobacteria bacterium]|nr:SDR family oxidoreductase [Gammaproteobacteria bacterium]
MLASLAPEMVTRFDARRHIHRIWSQDMQTIVVTGSTRGIGRGLAREFLQRGHRVVVTGRTQGSVDPAVAELSPLGEVLGVPCEVSDYEQVQAVWDAAIERFGRVDVWINNAALAPDHSMFAEIPAEQIAATVDANLTGTLYGVRVALAGMLKQGGGKIYTFEGFGSDGMKNPGLTVYGSTKYAVRYLTESLAKEYADTPIIIGSLSPGMVPTDLLIYSSRGEDQAKWEKSKRIMNILGDKVETVTPWLVEQALSNDKNGARIAWLTRAKAIRRFLLPGYKNRDIVGEYEREYEARSK